MDDGDQVGKAYQQNGRAVVAVIFVVLVGFIHSVIICIADGPVERYTFWEKVGTATVDLHSPISLEYTALTAEREGLHPKWLSSTLLLRSHGIRTTQSSSGRTVLV
jgi:hypothetical protein